MKLKRERKVADMGSFKVVYLFNRRPSSILLLLLPAIILSSLLVNYTITVALVQTAVPNRDTHNIPEQLRTKVPQRDEVVTSNLVENAVLVPSTIRSKYEGGKVDVLSIASKKRPEYAETQRRTWANHPLVRNFFNVTEDIDGNDSSCQSLSLKRVLRVPHWCRQRYLTGEPDDPNFSWLMQRFVHYYARKKWLKNKPNPGGWLCAQKRFPIGLANIVLGYAQRGESLPDYLLVVDDDTHYNMDAYYSEIVQNRVSSDPFVGAGCRITNGRNEDTGIVFPFGGFGLTFSKGSIERLLRPLSRSSARVDDKWQNATISALGENLIGELETFKDGMSLAEMMKEYALAEPFNNVSGWTRGYCFHGHWMLAIFTQLYRLHSDIYMEAIQDSKITLRSSKRGPQYTNLCKNEYQSCNSSDLVCHYQTPSDMERLTSNAAMRHDSGYEFPNLTAYMVDERFSDKPPMVVVKSRFMQFQPNLLALGKARLHLFETFCLPTILGQRDKDFLWLIRFDPALSDELLVPLKQLVEPHKDRIFLIASNDNTEGFRLLDVESMAIVSGNKDVLARTVSESRKRWLVETRLDADDGLHTDFIESIRDQAMDYMRGSKSSDVQWRAYCVGESINWHSGALSPVGDVNPNVTNTLNIPPEGLVSKPKRLKSCITPGLSYVLPPSVTAPPIIGHHILHEKVPHCDHRHDILGKKCFMMLDLGFPQAVQARTPTSHGMGGFHKEYHEARESKRLWATLDSSFKISKNAAKLVIDAFKENVVEIAKDNLAGQCTEDHTCSKFARRYLERIIWNKEVELNATRS